MELLKYILRAPPVNGDKRNNHTTSTNANTKQQLQNQKMLFSCKMIES
jgi:hypothetical protein